MKNIQILVDRITEEIEDAKEYAEEYLTHKAEGSTVNHYRQMAEDELQHAQYIHEEAVNKISDLKVVYTPPVEMEEEWNKAHKMFIEKEAWIKQMLAM